MALKSTVYKAELQISDLDRHYYATHTLTLARHPSETDERLMIRLAAFALNADPALEFGRGLSADDEPDLWRRDLTGVIELWIEVGLPDLKVLRRAAGRAKEVLVYAYGRGVAPWWAQNRADLARVPHLRVISIPIATSQALAALAERNMRLQFMMQDGEASLSTDQASVPIDFETLGGSRGGQSGGQSGH